MIAEALALHRPDASKKELAVVLQPYAGVWGSTRVRWSPARVNPETVSYRSLFREVQIGADGALRYSDLRAVEEGNYLLGASSLVVPSEVMDPRGSWSS